MRNRKFNENDINRLVKKIINEGSTFAGIKGFFSGDGYNYSNTNYILLGMLIQKITGSSPIIEIQNRIFKVLNLTHTYLPADLPVLIVPVSDMVNGYLYYHLPDPYSYLNGFYNPTWSSMSFYYTAGGIISTPEDINNYLHALFHPGILLTESEFTSLTTNMIDKGIVQ